MLFYSIASCCGGRIYPPNMHARVVLSFVAALFALSTAQYIQPPVSYYAPGPGYYNIPAGYTPYTPPPPHCPTATGVTTSAWSTWSATCGSVFRKRSELTCVTQPADQYGCTIKCTQTFPLESATVPCPCNNDAPLAVNGVDATCVTTANCASGYDCQTFNSNAVPISFHYAKCCKSKFAV
jgi:hypothetical protein